MQLTATSPKAYCNVLAIQKGLDPVGSAGMFEDALLIEIPLPWKRDVYTHGLPAEIVKLMAVWMQRYREGIPYTHRIILIAPDPALSVKGFRRMIFYQHKPGAFAAYDKLEYLVPESQLGALAWGCCESPADLARFDDYRVTLPTRDLLVCTHGTVDAACAKFGYPLYDYLRANHAGDDLRVWRCSHFGGHVYAPTMMDMPTGHYWAYVEPPQADAIVTYAADVSALRGHYRGWAGLESGFLQALDREVWQREGWSWFTVPKTGEVIAKDALAPDSDGEPAWAEVRLSASLPGGLTHFDARVEIHRHIEAHHTTGETGTHPYPQYAVKTLARSAP